MVQNNLLRITQINAVYLDKQVVKCLEDIIQDALKYMPPGITVPLESEMHLLIKLTVLYYSIIRTGSTFGQSLLSIKYENLTAVKKLLYVATGCLGYAKGKLDALKQEHQASDLLFKLDAVCKVCHLLNLTWFLRNGTKPQLVERFLGLDQMYAHENAQRMFESKYMARELLWNGFIEILVYVLPLINYHKIKRKMRQYNPFYRRASFVSLQTDRKFTLDSKCAYCGDTPILPHHMGCSHIFCYVCLKGNQIADSKFECPVCYYRSSNISCERVTAE